MRSRHEGRVGGGLTYRPGVGLIHRLWVGDGVGVDHGRGLGHRLEFGFEQGLGRKGGV